MEAFTTALINYPGGIFMGMSVLVFLGALHQAKNIPPNVWKAVIVFCSALGLIGIQLMLFKLLC